ncbi:MAG TPA: 4'-phosphopantetheinyl transferase superfamily protein [Myxococcales bacterium]|nr:4'-phosphopantetheinyl transferase superfamily protein [Myxococcales bacterium]
MRHWAKQARDTELFPAEVQILNQEDGRPIVRCSLDADLQISIAHKDEVAVALLSLDGNPGVDIEHIESRSQRFQELAFHESELSLLPEGEQAEWHTRLWSAKEAVGKARGTGLSYNPRSLKVSAIEGERFCVEGVWVNTLVDGEFVVAWTTL